MKEVIRHMDGNFQSERLTKSHITILEVMNNNQKTKLLFEVEMSLT